MKNHIIANQYRSDEDVISAVDDLFDQQDEVSFEQVDDTSLPKK